MPLASFFASAWRRFAWAAALALAPACGAGCSHALAGLAGTAAAPAPTYRPQNVYGIDLGIIDPACKPCDDFYAFADGKFAETHPIDDINTSASADDPRIFENQRRERDVLRSLARDGSSDADFARLGEFVSSCQDGDERDRAGVAPLAPEIARIDAVADTAGLVRELARIERIGAPTGLRLDAATSPADATRTIGVVEIGRLGLGDPRAYADPSPRSAEIRDAYLTHVAAMSSLLGAGPDEARASAIAILKLETAIAREAPSAAQRREPLGPSDVRTVAELARDAPEMPWRVFLHELGVGRLTSVFVRAPRSVRAVSREIAAEPLRTWRAYLKLRLIDDYAAALSQDVYERSFVFAAKISGARKPHGRFFRCLLDAQHEMRDTVSRAFAGDVPDRTEVDAMVAAIRSTFRARLGTVAWMRPATRAYAQKKLDALSVNVGAPASSAPLATFSFPPGVYATKGMAIERANHDAEFAGIGGPANRNRWSSNASDVNATNAIGRNAMFLPAGLLGPPEIDPLDDDAAKYGRLGATIGHEMTHGFDDAGRRFDAIGNVRDWWPAADAEAFRTRAKCIADEYGAFAVGDVRENGAAVMGEAIADLGGARLAYLAFEKTGEAKAHRSIGGYTPEQRFFIAYAQRFAINERPETERLYALNDAHPANRYRVVGTLSNMPEFAAAFHCPAIAAMVRAHRCDIW